MPSNDTTFQKEEIKRKIEIRAGRTICLRKINLLAHTRSSNEIDGVKQVNILFVHGSCAASSQFDDLIEALGEKISEEKQNSKDEDSKGPNLRINATLYDQLGCAESEHPSEDWGAFSSSEHLLDLEAVTQSILEVDDASPLFIVAHSHGVSQTIELVTCTSMDPSKVDGGLILIGGALKDGPAEMGKDGGHWIFRLPLLLLRFMQPSLSHGFFQAAVHPSNRERLRSKSFQASNKNDMQMCKAFYRQQTYVSSKEAMEVETKTLVIHGEGDTVIPLSSGEHLHQCLKHSEFVVVPESSHQVFQEKPEEVADSVMKFVKSTLRVG